MVPIRLDRFQRPLVRQLPLYHDNALSGPTRAALRVVNPTLKDAHEEWLGGGVDDLAPTGQVLVAIEFAGGGDDEMLALLLALGCVAGLVVGGIEADRVADEA
jgi:hypothetical protein